MTVSELFIKKIDLDLLKQYADASGDYNPIHVDEKVAKEAGLPGVIAHGMLVAGLVNERIRKFHEEELGSEWKLAQIQFRFKAMTFLDEEIHSGGSMTAEEDGSKNFQFYAKNAFGETKATAKVRFESV